MAAPLLLESQPGTAALAAAHRALGGRFSIVRRLAGSAMSDVYLARDLDLGRNVALKVLDPSAALDLEARGRFAREARTQAGLQHPAIVPVLDYAGPASLPVIVMPYVAGGSLAAWAAPVPARQVAALCGVLADVAEALDWAHRHGVVHRDVKPSNILVDDASGAPRGLLTDFGVAIVSTSDQSRSEISRAMGTPGYMAPEQIIGAQDYDGRGDFYSLGVVAFELLAGRSPYGSGRDELVAARQLAWDAPALEGVASELAGIVARCLRRDPRKRWKDGATLAAALRALKDLR